MKKTGRPTKYREELCGKVSEYISTCTDKTDRNGKIHVHIPTMEGLSQYLDVDRTSLFEWGKQHPPFSYSLEKLLAEQKKRLLNMGLSGDYNSTIAKLILSSNHGMNEKTETDITSKGEKITVDEKTTALAKEYEQKLKNNLK